MTLSEMILKLDSKFTLKFKDYDTKYKQVTYENDKDFTMLIGIIAMLGGWKELVNCWDSNRKIVIFKSNECLIKARKK